MRIEISLPSGRRTKSSSAPSAANRASSSAISSGLNAASLSAFPRAKQCAFQRSSTRGAIITRSRTSSLLDCIDPLRSLLEHIASSTDRIAHPASLLSSPRPGVRAASARARTASPGHARLLPPRLRDLAPEPVPMPDHSCSGLVIEGMLTSLLHHRVSRHLRIGERDRRVVSSDGGNR